MTDILLYSKCKYSKDNYSRCIWAVKSIVEIAGPEDTTDGRMPTVVVFYGFDSAYTTATNRHGFTEVEFSAVDIGRI